MGLTWNFRFFCSDLGNFCNKSALHSPLWFSTDGCHGWQCTGIFAFFICVGSQRQPALTMEFIPKSLDSVGWWRDAVSILSWGRLMCLNMFWAGTICVKLHSVFIENMHTLISGILIETSLWGLFLTSLTETSFTNHKHPTVYSIPELYLILLNHWMPQVPLELSLSPFAESIISGAWIITSHYDSPTDGDLPVCSQETSHNQDIICFA